MAQTNVQANIKGMRAEMREQIKQLLQQGITVNNDNEPAPENATPQMAMADQIYVASQLVKQTICPRCATGFANVEGKFKNTWQDEIAW